MIEFCLSSPTALVHISNFSAPSRFDGRLLAQIPGVGHHGLEVVVVVQRGGDLLVILDEFGLRYLSVPRLRLAVLDRIGSLKGVQELQKDSFLRLFPG